MEKLEGLMLNDDKKSLINELVQSNKDEHLQIAFLGEFSVGKTALINKLLDINLLPTHAIETTAIPTSIIFSETRSNTAVLQDGTEKVIADEELKDLKANEQNIDIINSLVLKVDSPAWLKGIEIIDTPGRNTKYESHIEASKKAIIEADVCIYVMTWRGLSTEDIIYIQEILQYQKEIIFVVNKTDLINQDTDVNEVVISTKNNLKEQLGLDFSVLATSIYNDELIGEFLETAFIKSKEQKKLLKENRLIHALTHVLNLHIKDLTNKIEKLKLIFENDSESLKMKKLEISHRIEEEQLKIEEFNSKVSKQLLTERNLIENLFEREFNNLKSTLFNEIQHYLNISNEEIKLELATKLLKIQEELKDKATNKIGEIVRNSITYTPSNIETNNINIETQEFDYSDLMAVYQERKEKSINQYESKKRRLENKFEQEELSDSELSELEEELKILKKEVDQNYSPQYIKDLPENINQNEKILNMVGFVADIALSTALAVVTAGGSAGAQAAANGGKIASKTAAKTVAKKAGEKIVKETAKESMKTVAKKTTEKVGKIAGQHMLRNAGKVAAQTISKTLKDEKLRSTISSGMEHAKTTIEKKKRKIEEESKEDSKKGQLALAALSFVTSPMQTITGNIGKKLDEQAIADANLKEDLNYKSEFYNRKDELLRQYREKQENLSNLKKNKQLKNEQRVLVEQKLQDNEKELENKTKQLEEQYTRELEEKEREFKKNQLVYQIDSLVEEEKNLMDAWIQIEIADLINVIRNSVPGIKLDQLKELQHDIENIDTNELQNNEETERKIKELQNAITNTESFIGDLYV